MLFVLHGTDIKKSRTKLHELTDSLLKKKPDANLFNFGDETFSPSVIDEYAKSQGLFSQNYIVVLDGILGTKNHEDTVVEQLKDISGSTNVFVIIEERIDTKALKKISKEAAKVQEFFLDEEKPKKEFKLFTLTDAFGRKDKLALWLEFKRAGENDIPAEEIHSMLLWQTRSMILAESAKDVGESGLKPFVHKKAKSFAKNFSGKGLQKVSQDLMEVFHRARRGEFDLGDGIEKWMLEL